MPEQAVLDVDVAAERMYERIEGSGAVRLRVYRPIPDPTPGGDWRCRLVIDGLGRPVDRWVHGVDGVQALGLALEMARSHLQPSPEHPALVTWLGQADLGLPRLLPSRAR
jgi:uncharacterized protein DUF6968